ncbi:MAG: capsular exopolysaccharide family protein, partial [Deltaproteobacteria bacterium]
EKIRENFEVVIFDSPPLLSVTDAAEIAPFLDGVVLVIKAGSTTRPAIQRSIQQLSELNVPIVGCILNDVDFEKEHYYYSPYQYYYQYYYEGEEGKSS